MALISALLVVLQVVATADHLGSAAFAAGLGQPMAGVGGFLDICKSPRPTSAPPADGSLPELPPVCPACVIATAAAGGLGAAPPALVAPVDYIDAQITSVVADLADPKPWRRFGATRGPPRARGL